MRFFYFHNLVTVGQTYESQFILKKNIHQEIFFFIKVHIYQIKIFHLFSIIFKECPLL